MLTIKRLHHRVFTFLLTLLLLGGVVNEAWADVTYHILTRPFTTKKTDGTDNKTNIRVEALRVVVQVTDNGGKVGLPDKFKSPLLKDAAYHYYSTATVTQKVQIYQNNATKLDTYADLTGVLTPGTSDVSDNDHIYVTYDYDPSDSDICTAYGQSLKLDGSEAYNIEVGSDAFFCLNVIRGNRPAVLPKEDQIKNIDDITSKEPVTVINGLYNDYDKITGKLFYFRWKLMGNDPYSIMLVLDYDGTATYVEEGKTKPLKVAGDNISNRLWTKFGNGGSDNKMWVSYDSNYEWKNETWTKREGYYRGNNPIFESFVLLNHSPAYTLVPSKVNHNGNNWQPNASNNYMHLGSTTLNAGDQLNPNAKFKTFANAPKIQFYKMKEYVFNVKTPITNTVLSQVVCVSDYSNNDDPKDHVPDVLKRKYVTFTGGYKETGLTNKYASFAAVDADGSAETDGSGRKIIWLKYETSMPFTTCTKASPTYDDLTWYNFYTNKESQYIVRYNSTNTSFNTTGTDGSRYARTSHFAFVGDPYELKIVSRKLADDNSGTLRYLKLNDPVTGNITQDATGTAWDIVYDDNTGTHADCFRLREFTTTNNSTNYLGWDYGTSNYPLKGVTTEAAATRLNVIPVPKKTYVYHIMRSDHSIAAKASTSQDASTKLDLAHIPSAIRSPFLALTGVTLKFYDTELKAQTHSDGTDIIYAPDDATSDSQEIWVRYDGMAAALAAYKTKLNNTQTFFVNLYDQFIYYDSSSSKVKSTQDDIESHKTENAYKWRLEGSDPYAMKIFNVQANGYVKVTKGNEQTISFVTEANASLFIAKSSTSKSYECMLATGDDDDATTTYYNIGRETNEVKLYSQDIYDYGNAELRFLFTPTEGSKTVTYHLIDSEKRDLLTVTARHTNEDTPLLPDAIKSPLVPEDGFHYWKYSNFTVVDGIFTLKESQTELTEIGDNTDVYVTYDECTAIDLRNKRTMFLLQFQNGASFRQEDGHDDLTDSPVPAIYPYCNGDCNFFVYGQAEYDLQQEGAASTRTRWAWFLESANADPYHVKICSRQTETYNGEDIRAYFRTYQPDDYREIVTGLVWPDISGLQGTEYMILGSTGQYRLVTTQAVKLDVDHDNVVDVEEGDGTVRRTLTSFEQYWKTYDTVKNKLLKDILEDKDKGANKDGSILVPTTPASYRDRLTGTGEGQYGFHSYNKWAYAKRFNGYNKDGKTSKGWEELEHWFQTVNMGAGYFDLIPIDIDPALILLDQHGWEIMRKPLPSSPTDEAKAAKYDAIRPYDSPMVEAYYFWTKASKRTGFHQYYNLSQQVTVDGTAYKSTSLTNLPPYDAKNVKDAKGNVYDQYVTYTVKDEYTKSYSVSYTTAPAKDADNKDYTRITSVTGTGQPFLIQQGNHYASVASGEATSVTTNTAPDGMQKYIIDNIGNLTTTGSKNNELWYVVPNIDIDDEMGYTDPNVISSITWVNDYRDKAKVKDTGFNSWAFDPYNIQITSVPYSTKHFKTNATGAILDDGALIGTYSSDPTVTLGERATGVTCTWYDSRALDITNLTFMAVKDAEGNMQLMPRFDHTTRMKDFSTLVAPSDPGIAESYTKLYRPVVYNYQIIDNQGRESLRYQSGGDLVPQTPDHFKSPLATNFKYYSSQTDANSDGVYDDEITESFASVTLTDGKVYVRYEYDESADDKHILQGKWLTMQLNDEDAKYDGGIKEGTSKPDPVDGDEEIWQWKFLETPQSDPDPYAVSLYNRSQSAGTKAIDKRFALLSHNANGTYALAEAGKETYTYDFLNGNGAMSTTVAATTATEAGFLSTSCSFSGTNSQIKLLDNVTHTFAYKVYTNGGVFAISENQDHATLEDNEFEPKLPENIQSPLLASNQYRYYNKDNFTFSEGNIATTDTIGKALSRLYGLYDDEVIVRYTAYDTQKSSYLVPNKRNNPTGADPVAVDNESNNTPIDISNNLLYNIIWYDDNMMKSEDGITITADADSPIQADAKHEWKLDGNNDPYAIKLRNKSANKCIYSSDGTNCALDGTNATTFMLLDKDGYDHGVLQVTGGTKMLSGYGQILEESDATHPTKFIIFALATHRVIYRLIIKNIGSSETIPYRKKRGDDSGATADEKALGVLPIDGSTQRDLSTDTYQLGETVTWHDASSIHYGWDAGQISLGDPLTVPAALERPNCIYLFYVDNIQKNNPDYDSGDPSSPQYIDDTEMNDIFKGVQVTEMGKDEGLLGKDVFINIVYKFNAELATNSGSGFVLDPSEKKWYTFETNDETPYLAHYTYKDGELTGIEGRIGHYTNDFLWSPVGDPYGFKMYNRYVYKNGTEFGHANKVMTTTSTPAATNHLIMKEDATTNPVYELLPGDTDGYFKVQTLTAQDGTPLYIDNEAGVLTLKTSTATEWTYGLSDALLDPYYLGAGNVGGLTDDGKAAYEAAGDLMAKQAIVYDDEYIVSFEPGYYRIFNQPNSKGIAIPRYLSGYTHKTELTPGTGTEVSPVAIPMHFYERENVNTSFEILGSGFTVSPATRGAISIMDPEYDPASIFYISGSGPYTMETQGLKVLGNKMTNSTGTSFYIDDIGGAVVVIHDGNADIASRNYLNYDQTDAAHIYDVKYTDNLGIADETKWCMEPANKQGLTLAVNSGGDSEVYGTTYYYSSFCAPFDVLLPNDDGSKVYKAYTCASNNGGSGVLDSPWPTSAPYELHPRLMSHYNKEAYSCPSAYCNSYKFVPAGTPVLIATTDNAGVVKMTIPTSAPSTATTTAIETNHNIIFTGEYLEQKLTGTDIVYTFGLPFTSELTMDSYSGDITGTLPTKAETGVGFYKNANPNYENGLSKAEWTRNNFYVLHNKIYYRAAGGGSREMRGIEFVPVIFDDDLEGEEQPGEEEQNPSEGATLQGDGCIYDMMGRKVATRQQVSWRLLRPGIYILNGKKFRH